MTLFRNLLFWIVLILLGALAAQFLAQDPGYVLVRYGGYDYEMTAASAALVLAGVLVGLLLVWSLITLPFGALRRRRERRRRALLGDGLDALEQGHWSRAEKALLQASEDPDVAAVARVNAARAAAARGEPAQALAHLDALPLAYAGTRAVAAAELAMAAGRPADALAALDVPDAQPLPPRGLGLRAEALAALGRAGEAYGLLGALRQQQAWPEARLAEREARWAEAGLREADDPNVLADRWEALPKTLRTDPAAVAAYAERAAALRWDEAATSSIETALDARWDENLARLYGRLPVGRLDARYRHAERWLQAHPDSPALLVTLARLAQAGGDTAAAETWLHRALAQGAGAEAWESLGDIHVAAGNESAARLSYANALQARRGGPVLPFPEPAPDRPLDIGVEVRDANGVPGLPARSGDPAERSGRV